MPGAMHDVYVNEFSSFPIRIGEYMSKVAKYYGFDIGLACLFIYLFRLTNEFLLLYELVGQIQQTFQKLPFNLFYV